MPVQSISHFPLLSLYRRHRRLCPIDLPNQFRRFHSPKIQRPVTHSRLCNVSRIKTHRVSCIGFVAERPHDGIALHTGLRKCRCCWFIPSLIWGRGRGWGVPTWQKHFNHISLSPSIAAPPVTVRADHDKVHHMTLDTFVSFCFSIFIHFRFVHIDGVCAHYFALKFSIG